MTKNDEQGERKKPDAGPPAPPDTFASSEAFFLTDRLPDTRLPSARPLVALDETRKAASRRR